MKEKVQKCVFVCACNTSKEKGCTSDSYNTLEGEDVLLNSLQEDMLMSVVFKLVVHRLLLSPKIIKKPNPLLYPYCKKFRSLQIQRG